MNTLVEYPQTESGDTGETSDKLRELAACYPELVANCDARGLAMLEQTDHVQFPPGTVMFRENAPCRNFLWLLEGSVRVYRHSPDGREVTLYRIEPGDLCILSLNTLLGGQAYPAQAVVESDIKGLMISGASLLNTIDESPALRRYVMKMLTDRLYQMMSLVSDIAFQRLDLRLACLLGQRFERSGGAPLEVTHAQLARELGTTREVVSRILKEFEHQECVKLARGRIMLVSRQGLEWFAGES